MTALLEAFDLGYIAGGRRVFAGIDLAVEPGQRLAVIGPSGSGKSSLLALLAGLAQPSEGEVRFDGQVVSAI